MRKIISARLAGNILLALFALLAIFHMLLLLGFLPATIVWGGRIENQSDFLCLELLALAMTVVWSIIVALKMGYLSWIKKRKIINAGVWLLFAFFVFNTLGNFLANSTTEQFFGIITIIAALLTLRLAMEPEV